MSTSARAIRIEGVGAYVPQRVVTSRELDNRCGVEAGWIELHTGIRERRWVDTELPSDMGALAAAEALEEAELAPGDLGLIVNASGTPERMLPDGGALLQQKLGLGKSGIPAITVHATCLSFLVGLEYASSQILAGRCAHALVVSSETPSVGANLDDPASGSLLGDAAAGVVLGRAAQGSTSRLGVHGFETYGDAKELATILLGVGRMPFEEGSERADVMFKMDGPRLTRFTLRHLGPFLDRLRPGLSRGLTGIDLVVPHQPNVIALAALGRYGWPADRVAVTGDRFGNCMAASIPLTLHEVVRSGRLPRGDTALLLGTGAGVSFGGTLLTY